MKNQDTLSVGDWMIILLLISIPIINIIMLFVWALSSDTNETKSNFAKAVLMWFVVIIILWILLFASLAGILYK
jgi:heme/copper-type cytochrome/quinol oxidase subunit 2